MRALLINPEFVGKNKAFLQFYLRDPESSYGPLVLDIGVLYIARKEQEARYALQKKAEIDKKLSAENVRAHCDAKDGYYGKILWLKGKDLDDFVSRNYSGFFEKVGGTERVRLSFRWPQEVELDERLSECVARQKKANARLRWVHNSYILPLLIAGLDYDDCVDWLLLDNHCKEELARKIIHNKKVFEQLSTTAFADLSMLKPNLQERIRRIVSIDDSLLCAKPPISEVENDVVEISSLLTKADERNNCVLDHEELRAVIYLNSSNGLRFV